MLTGKWAPLISIITSSGFQGGLVTGRCVLRVPGTSIHCFSKLSCSILHIPVELGVKPCEK